MLSACATSPDTLETRQQLAEELAQLVLHNGGYALIQEQVTVSHTYNLVEKFEDIMGRPVDFEYRNAYRNSFKTAFYKNFPLEDWVAPVAEYYRTEFDSAELTALLKLYRKPASQQVLQTGFAIAAESADFGQALVKEKVGEYIQVFNIEVKQNQP